MTMILTDVLKPDCVKVPLLATDKHSAIDELVDLLVENGRATDALALKDAIWQRETTRTTGIGHGLAIPHGKCDAVSRLVMAVGKPAQPIDFDAVDGRPVSVIFLLASPHDQTGPHIQVLAQISRIMTRPEIRNAIFQAESAQDIYQIIQQQEQQTAP